MKNLKKVLALVTMFTMLLSVAVSAGALYPDVEDNASYAEAVETLNVLGIMIGDEKGNFNPDASITRAETAAIVTRMKALGNAATGSTNFTDVAADHWAAGYINLAEQSGIINGYGDGTFGPSDAVTYEQVIKMIVAALGRTPEAESKGGYPSGYMIVAAQEDMTAGVTVTAGAEAPRAAVARLVYNALEVPVMEQDGFKVGEESYVVLDGTNNKALKTLLKDYLKVNKYEGVINSTYLSKGDVEGDAKIYMIEEKINGTTNSSNKLWTDAEKDYFLEGETGAAAYVGYNVSAYAQVNDDDEAVLLGVAKKANRNEVLELAFTDIEKIEAGKTLYYFASASASKAEDIELDANAICFSNGGESDRDEIDELFLDYVGDKKAKVSGVLTLINNDKDEAYDVIMLNQATANYVVGAIDAEEMALEDRKGGSIDLDLDDETKLVKFFKADGTAAEFADIAEGNVLTVYEAANGAVFTVYISDVTVEGKVTEESTLSNEEKAYKIGDGTYTVAYGVKDVNIKVGDEGTFYINVEGKVVDKVATAASGSYAYLYKALETSDINGSTVELKFLTSEGVWETKTLASKVSVVNNGKDASFSMTDGATKIAEALKGFLKVAPEYLDEAKTKKNPDAGKLVEEGKNRLFQYDLNSEGKIRALYVCDDDDDAERADSLSLDRIEPTKTYSASQNKIGKIFFNEETKVFFVKNDAKEEKDIILTKASALFVDGEEYDSVKAYDWEYSVPAIAVVEDDASSILAGTKLLVITRVSETTNAAGSRITKIYGMQDGQEVSGEQSDNGWTLTDDEKGTVSKLNPGDVVIFSLDAVGAIDNVEVLMSYKDATDAITANHIAEGIKNDAVDEKGMSQNIFGYVSSKDNGQLWLTDGFNGAPLKDGDEEVAIPTNGSDINVYEITVKDTPTFDTISVSKIKETYKPEKEGHWAYVRMYDDAVVDIVVYKKATPAAPKAPKIEATATDGKLVITQEDGADILYAVDEGTFAPYEAGVTTIAASGKISAKAVSKKVESEVVTATVTYVTAPTPPSGI